MDKDLQQLSIQAGQLLLSAGATVTAAESCTGGWIAKVLTDISGSSAWFEQGFVTYSNAAKMQMLGVNAETLTQHGAVSEATVREMARGAQTHASADYAIAVSGILGQVAAVRRSPWEPSGLVSPSLAANSARHSVYSAVIAMPSAGRRCSLPCKHSVSTLLKNKLDTV